MRFIGASFLSIAVALPVALLLPTHLIEPCHAAERIGSGNRRRRDLKSKGSSRSVDDYNPGEFPSVENLSRQELCAASAIEFTSSGKAGKNGKNGKNGKGKGKGKGGKNGSKGGSRRQLERVLWWHNSCGKAGKGKGKGKGKSGKSGSRRLNGSGQGGGSGAQWWEDSPSEDGSGRQYYDESGSGRGYVSGGGGSGVHALGSSDESYSYDESYSSESYDESYDEPGCDVTPKIKCEGYCSCICGDTDPYIRGVVSGGKARGKAGGKSGKSGGKSGKSGKSHSRGYNGSGNEGGYYLDMPEIDEIADMVEEECGPCFCESKQEPPTAQPTRKPTRRPPTPRPPTPRPPTRRPPTPRPPTPHPPTIESKQDPPTAAPTPSPTPAPTPKPTPKFVTPQEVCVESHPTFGKGAYAPLAGWSFDVDVDTVINCDDSGIWDLGWKDDGKFDFLELVRDGEVIMEWGDSCPVDYPVKEGDRLVFYSDNSHEYDGFRICLAEGESRQDDGNGNVPEKAGGFSKPPEGIIQGNCFVSHATWDGVNNDYPNHYGYTIPIGRPGKLNALSFNIRGRMTGQSLSLWRNGEMIQKWQGESGPYHENVNPGDTVTFFVDDSRHNEGNTGFKVCFEDSA